MPWLIYFLLAEMLEDFKVVFNISYETFKFCLRLFDLVEFDNRDFTEVWVNEFDFIGAV